MSDMDTRTPAEKLGGVLKRARISLGMTQAEIAELSGLNRRAISRIEKGASVSMEKATALAMALQKQGAPIALGSSSPAAPKPAPKPAAPEIKPEPRLELIRHAARRNLDVLLVDIAPEWTLHVPGSKKALRFTDGTFGVGDRGITLKRETTAQARKQCAANDLVADIATADGLRQQGLFVPLLPKVGEHIDWHTQDSMNVQVF